MSVHSIGTAGCFLLSCCVCCCLSEIEAKYDKKMKMLRDELDLRRKTEIHEVEERKNGQISTLMQRHEEAFTDMKNYYNDITLNNLALINSLKVPGAMPGPHTVCCPPDAKSFMKIFLIMPFTVLD